MSRDTWGCWAFHAKERHVVMLANGWIAELMAARRNARSCKIRIRNRHYSCWVEDIVLVSNDTAQAGDVEWYQLDPWSIVDLTAMPRDITLRPSTSGPSKHWLHVTPNPTRIPLVTTPDPALR